MRARVRAGAAALGCAAVLLAASGCAGRRLREGATPFPAKAPVMTDEAGTPVAGLPPSPEPLKLVVLDFPWCTPCADVWEAVGKAGKAAPAGTIRVYRILFDREKLDTARGTLESPPLVPVPPPPATGLPVTTLTALPGPFRERYGPRQAPTILLADESGRILKVWTGYAPSLAGSLREEIARRAR